MFIILKRKSIALFFLFCATILFSGLLYPLSQSTITSSPASALCVVLDAGHGGIDGGSQGSTGVYERDINLAITNKIQTLLNNMGISVVQTRRTQDGLYGVFASGFKMRDMKERKRIIEESGADLVVSIHMNYFSDSSAKGAQIFYKPNDEVSETLATNMQNFFTKNLENARKECKEGDFYILTCTQTPGILIECGYLSNPEEEKLLISDEYQDKLAYQIFCGIVAYYGLE